MAKLPDGWLSVLFEHGIDLPNRRVFIGDIDSDSALVVTKGLYALETQNPFEPIDLFINSPGGDVDSTLGIYDIMNTVKCPIYTFASGVCMSSALLLLAAGKNGNRWVSPHLNLMTHDYSAGIEGLGRHLRQELKYHEKLDSVWLDIFAKLTNKPVSFWKRLSHKSHNYYFDAEQAITYGVADNHWVEK